MHARTFIFCSFCLFVPGKARLGPHPLFSLWKRSGGRSSSEGRMPPLDDSDSDEEHDLDQEEEEDLIDEIGALFIDE